MLIAGPVQRGWKRVDGIDLLRGLSIFLVLMNHVNVRLRIAKVPYLSGIPDALASAFIWNGENAVQIFFVVSGFLIASTTIRRWGTLSQVVPRDFYLLRFARIAPLLLALLIVLSGLDVAGVKDFIVPANRGGLGRALLAALTFHVNLLESHRGYLPGNWDILWSLSIEETFYLFFPVVCALFGLARLLIPILCGFVVLGPFGRTVFATGLWKDYSYLGGMEGIALGCLTAILVANRRFSRTTLSALAAAGIAIIVFVLAFSRLGFHWMFRSGLDMTILGLGVCPTLIPAAQTEWRSPRWLAPLRQMGRRSYEIYLTHMFVVFAFFDFFVSRGKPRSAVPLLFIATIVVAGLVGELVARLYSDPMNRWLRVRFGHAPDRLGRPVDSARVGVRGAAA